MRRGEDLSAADTTEVARSRNLLFFSVRESGAFGRIRNVLPGCRRHESKSGRARAGIIVLRTITEVIMGLYYTAS